MANAFIDLTPAISNNSKIRTPQKETFAALEVAAVSLGKREVGVVLPVGCGKSGCIALAPFAYKSKRTLVVAPGVSIGTQLFEDFDPALDTMFYKKCSVLSGAEYPEPAIIRGASTNISDLEDADVVVTNIQQLQGETNKWLTGLPNDFFDLILFDEGHHNVAASWTTLKQKFPSARIVNFSATPLRADGQLMAGEFIYSYPIFRAIQEGYVKHLKALVLNPATLRYVRREDSQEIEVSLEEVRRLGEVDADFRRSIVTSEETLSTIVDASIRALERLRKENADNKLKIIASALNYEHCIQIVEAYKARGKRADYVHSKADSRANERVLKKLEDHELDVIVQVRMLGEGFDHPYLAVAAVFSVFSNLSPFVQFVGRIMRVIVQNSPGNPLNQGVVVFHAGANIAKRWSDFQSYSQADQDYFDQLLPVETFDPTGSGEEHEIDPVDHHGNEQTEVRAQSDVQLEEIPLLEDDPAALEALRLLQEKGYTLDQVAVAYQTLQPVAVTKQRERQAKRGALDSRIMNAAAKLLKENKINPEGQNLDKKRLGRSNLIVLKSAIDAKINAHVGKNSGQRGEMSRADLESIENAFDELVRLVAQEVLNG